jgi:hypothetical protein
VSKRLVKSVVQIRLISYKNVIFKRPLAGYTQKGEINTWIWISGNILEVIHIHKNKSLITVSVLYLYNARDLCRNIAYLKWSTNTTFRIFLKNGPPYENFHLMQNIVPRGKKTRNSSVSNFRHPLLVFSSLCLIFSSGPSFSKTVDLVGLCS